MDSDINSKTNGTDTNYDVNQDDDFKELLVRKVARAVKKKNMPIKMFLERLQSNLGRDCKELWSQMVTTTTDKLKNLLDTNDLLEESNIIMQLSATEWLLYDLVLVHQKINVADNQDMPECLNELFRLIQWHEVENLVGAKLAKAWIHLTVQYNKRGRMVSPMLLQQRWYQLKETARKKVFDQVKVLNEKKIKLLHSIAIKYQKIITQPYPAWQNLIKQKRVILPEQFVEILNKEDNWKLHAHELWYLEINRELHDGLTTKIEKHSNNVTNGIPITIKSGNEIDNESCEKPKDPLSIHLIYNQQDNDSLKQLISEKMKQYLVDTPKSTDLLKDQLDNDSDKQVTSKNKEQYLEDRPKVFDLPIDQHHNDSVKQVESKEKDQYLVDTPKLIDLPKHQLDHNPLKQAIPEEKEEYLVDIPTPKSKSKDPLLLDTDDELDNISNKVSDIISGLSENIIENSTDDTQDEINKDTTFGEKSMGEVTKKGIVKRKNYLVVEKTDYLNKDIDLIDVNKKKKQKNQSHTVKSRYATNGNLKQTYIDNDSKLRKKAIVSTKKLDNMNIFKDIVYDVVKDKKVIECALLESKPILKHVSRDKHDGVAQNVTVLGRKNHDVLIEDDIIQNANLTTSKSLKSTSALFRKPKRRTYYTKQLQKNPDFNMELKKLTPEFISSTSNKILLEKCMPLTIDVHKDFENKLINGRIRINNAKKFKSANATVTKKVYNVGTESQYKVSETNISKEIVMDKHYPQEDISEASQRTSPTVHENNKIINLPNVDQISYINQGLLTADIKETLNESFNKQPEINQPVVVQSTEKTFPLEIQVQKEELNDLENILHEESSLALHEDTYN